jgi:hypothetical protein
MATRAVLQIGLALEDAPANIDADLDACYPDRIQTLKYLERLLGHVGAQKHKLSVRVDSSTDGSSDSPLDRAAPTITITFANITATETVVIGTTTLEWVVASANEDEVTIGADLAAATTNLTAAINAHSTLSKLFIATGVTATGVVTVTFTGDPRLGALIGLSETGDATVVSATSFALDTTEAGQSDSRLYDDGGLL